MLIKNIIPVVLSLLLIAFVPVNDCGGVYRWDNKILIDSKGLEVFKNNPTTSSIHALVHISRPPNEQLGRNRSTPELRKVTVTAWLVGLGKEPDADYHLILTSVDNKDSMIAEIPDPDCSKLNHFPGLRSNYAAARVFIEENVDDSPGNIHFLQTKIKVKITGVLFFDRIAHGKGHSINGIEIHPVLQIKKA